MSVRWNEQAGRWFEAASEYTGYHRRLAEILKRYIPQGESLCDLGCGAGRIDLELAEHCSGITCVDLAPEAIACVQRGAQQRGIRSIRALCADAETFSRPHATVMALFFGGGQAYERFFPLAEKRLILAVRGQKKGTFGPEGYQFVKDRDAQSVREDLERRGAAFEYEAVSLEYGQPLADRADAEAFVRAYCRPMGEEVLARYLDAALERTGDARWPYYLPNRKEIGLFIIRRDGNG